MDKEETRSEQFVCSDEEMQKHLRELATTAIRKLKQHKGEFLLILRNDDGGPEVGYGLVMGLATEPDRPVFGLLTAINEVKTLLDEMVQHEVMKMDPAQVLAEMFLFQTGEEGGFTI